MREEIAASHKPNGPWDLKYATGGLVDLEFALEYLQLREAARAPKLAAAPTLGEALAAAQAAGALSPAQAAGLSQAINTLSAAQFLLRLCTDGQPATRDLSPAFRTCLAKALGEPSFRAAEAAIRAARGQVSTLWRSLFGASRPD
jgi:[glutamine synthetase] adenylyltransferase / [glutamine synthetase]-adenylyl-L-tyrosine phosphorylase